MNTEDESSRTPRIAVVMSAFGSDEEASRVAAALVNERLAACCQAMPIRSTYRWQGRLCNDAEVLLLVKTATPEGAVAKIKELHSYELPEIIVTPVEGGDAAYIKWVAEVSSTE